MRSSREKRVESENEESFSQLGFPDCHSCKGYSYDDISCMGSGYGGSNRDKYCSTHRKGPDRGHLNNEGDAFDFRDEEHCCEHCARNSRCVNKSSEQERSEFMGKSNSEKAELLTNIKLFDDSVREIEIMKDRLEVWRDRLVETSSNISRDSMYIKEIGTKVLERKIDEIMRDRKRLLDKLINRVENFSKVMNTSMECMSNSIFEFEKNVYGSFSGCNGNQDTTEGERDVGSHSNSKKVCRSFYQLSQRLKDIMINIDPYIMNKDLGANDMIDISNEKKPVSKDEHIFREPLIMIIDPKNMENMYLNYDDINSSKLDIESKICSSIVINSLESSVKTGDFQPTEQKESKVALGDKDKGSEKNQASDIKHTERIESGCGSAVGREGTLKDVNSSRSRSDNKKGRRSFGHRKCSDHKARHKRGKESKQDVETETSSELEPESESESEDDPNDDLYFGTVDNSRLRKLIKDYSSLYAEYVVKNNLCKIIGKSVY